MDIARKKPPQASKDFATKDETIQAGKAVFDEVKLLLSKSLVELETKTGSQELRERLIGVEKSLSDYHRRLGDVKSSSISQAGKMLEKMLGEEVGKHLQTLTKAYQEKVQELEKANRAREMDAISRVTKALEVEFSRRLDAIAGQKGDYLANIQKSYELGYQAGFDQIKTLLQSLPVPQVNISVPENAIQVKQQPSQVTVNVPDHAIEVKMLPSQVILPENAIQMKMLPSQVDVHVPEKAIQVQMEKSLVTVNVPEQKAADVHFNVPVRKVKKLISYDSLGRPVEIIEIEE